MARVLLVEDHQALANMRRAVLLQRGYEVVCAADGKEACRLLREGSFDVVVTDSELPKATGWEVASVAKKKSRDLPVILSSGWPLRLTPEQVALRGVDYVAPKPCGLEQLLQLIEKALRRTPSAKLKRK